MKFELSETQEQKLDDWRKALKVIYPNEDLHLEYRFTPTGLGDCVEVFCRLANAKIDLTEEDKW